MTKKKEQPAPFSLQRIFDKAAVGLLRQGKRSQDSDKFECRYRGAGDCKCAVGFLIEDEHYSPAMEGPKINYEGGGEALNVSMKLLKARDLTWIGLKESGIDVKSKGVLDLLSELQHCHDLIDVDHWPTGLKKIASAFNLSTKSIDKVMEENGTES